MHNEDVVVRQTSRGKVVFYREPALDSPLLQTHAAWRGNSHRFERTLGMDQITRSNAAEMHRVMQLLPPLDAVTTDEGSERNATAIFVGSVPHELMAYFAALKPFQFSLLIEPLQLVRPNGSHVVVSNEFVAKLRWRDPRFGAQAVNTSLMAPRCPSPHNEPLVPTAAATDLDAL